MRPTVPSSFVTDRHACIQTLRDAHAAAGREAELARGFLLQRRGRERRRRTALAFLRLNVADDEAALGGFLELVARRVRVVLVGEIELLELLAVETKESRLERLVRVGE